MEVTEAFHLASGARGEICQITGMILRAGRRGGGREARGMAAGGGGGGGGGATWVGSMTWGFSRRIGNVSRSSAGGRPPAVSRPSAAPSTPPFRHQTHWGLCQVQNLPTTGGFRHLPVSQQSGQEPYKRHTAGNLSTEGSIWWSDVFRGLDFFSFRKKTSP